MMSRSHIRVIYDGPAVADGEMDVAQLASSLLALGKLIENADVTATGEAGRVRVKVQADVQRGSFDIGIVVSTANSVIDTAKAWLISPSGTETIGILSLLGLNAKDGMKGVIQVVRWLKGRKIVSRTSLRDGNVIIEVEGGEQLEIAPDVARLIEEPTVRQPLERFTEPLREDGVQEIRFEEERGIPLERISNAESGIFLATASADPTSTSRFKATYQIKRLYFERGKKWRFSNGSQTIMASIEDDVFWKRIESAEENFSSADYLVCNVRMDQWFGLSGLKTEFTIEQVEEHIPAPRQGALDI